jgi:hypothetical protein
MATPQFRSLTRAGNLCSNGTLLQNEASHALGPRCRKRMKTILAENGRTDFKCLNAVNLTRREIVAKPNRQLL